MKKEHPSTDELITSNGFKFMALVRKRWQWATLLSCASCVFAAGGYLGRIAWADRTNFMDKVEAVAAHQTAADAKADAKGVEVNVRLNVMFEKLELVEKSVDKTNADLHQAAKESQDRDNRIMELLIRGR